MCACGGGNAFRNTNTPESACFRKSSAFIMKEGMRVEPVDENQISPHLPNGCLDGSFPSHLCNILRIRDFNRKPN
ncbi:hypothetical protein CEXT_415801 [Caerostris extrusa]|uniref:Uncharacterized protein n=1 Tax=Caerostris extrusa TaxID=172846 RepID=A0AAV4ME14_CAEEX|nr:hypothetical protein CEXT_415801 [Caerostris extrusa]